MVKGILTIIGYHVKIRLSEFLILVKKSRRFHRLEKFCKICGKKQFCAICEICGKAKPLITLIK